MLNQPVTDIFFDLDHTLWDFERNSALTYRKIFELHGMELDLEVFLGIYVPANLRFWKMYREGRITKQALRRRRLQEVFGEMGLRVDTATVDRLADAYIEYLSTHTHLVPYSREILEYLGGRYRLHIITNGFEEVQFRKLKNSGIASFFTEVINSERAGVKKPHPAIFRLALRLAGAQPGNCVMIGDNLEADILGARAVGLQTLHYNVHNDPAHENGPVITHLREIKSYL